MLFEQSTQRVTDYFCSKLLVTAVESNPIRVLNPTETSTLGECGLVKEVKAPVASVYSDANAEGALDLFNDLSFDYSTLTWDEQSKLKDLLTKYKHIFASNDSQITGTPVMAHKIVLNNTTSFRHKAYRFPIRKESNLTKKLYEMLESGLIRPSCSPFASPVVLVKKPDGTLRVCIDYRTLNSRTVPDSYLLPRVDESMEFLSGAKYLTTLDLYQGFHQVNLEEECKQYTAFITARGLFEYNRMPQGAQNSEAEVNFRYGVWRDAEGEEVTRCGDGANEVLSLGRLIASSRWLGCRGRRSLGKGDVAILLAPIA